MNDYLTFSPRLTRLKLFVFIFCLALVSLPLTLSSEALILHTYYPSPYASYDTLIARTAIYVNINEANRQDEKYSTLMHIGPLIYDATDNQGRPPGPRKPSEDYEQREIYAAGIRSDTETLVIKSDGDIILRPSSGKVLIGERNTSDNSFIKGFCYWTEAPGDCRKNFEPIMVRDDKGMTVYDWGGKWYNEHPGLVMSQKLCCNFHSTTEI